MHDKTISILSRCEHEITDYLESCVIAKNRLHNFTPFGSWTKEYISYLSQKQNKLSNLREVVYIEKVNEMCSDVDFSRFRRKVEEDLKFFFTEMEKL